MYLHADSTPDRRSARSLQVAACAVVLVLAALWLFACADEAGAVSVNAYRGHGAWVDIYDSKAWGTPEAAVADMAQHGVRTLFLETANFRIDGDLVDEAGIGRFIEAAHERHLKIVAWYLPGFDDLDRDARRSLAAIRFRSPRGQRFDSFALDIEHRGVKPVSLRAQRAEQLSRRIRSAVGSRYPLGAIIPSPVALEWSPPYWTDFPYMMIADVYDVVLAMGYYTFHGNGSTQAYRETLENVAILREKMGSRVLPINVIGGIAEDSSSAETTAYVRALRVTGSLGGGLYSWPHVNDGDWSPLKNVRTNPRQSPALPVTVGYLAPLGNCRGDTSHPKEVFFSAPAQNGDRVLRLRLWDVQSREVRLIVNWRTVATFRAGPRLSWTGVRRVDVPAKYWRASGSNVIGLVARGEYPNWTRWGVRDLRLSVR